MILSLASLLLVFALVIFETFGLGFEGNFNDGLIIVALLLLIMICFIGVVRGCRNMARSRTNTTTEITAGKNVLAHWTYSDAEWLEFFDAGYRRHKILKWIGISIIPAWAIFSSICYAIINPQYVIYAPTILIPFIPFESLVVFLTSQQSYHHNKGSKGEALIASGGIILNGKLFDWHVVNSRLESVEYLEATLPMIRLEYSVDSLNGGKSSKVLVPIPAGQEKSARDIVQFFNDALGQSAPGQI